MTEHITAGATGAAERISLDAYKHAIRTAPELLHHLAHLVTPGRLLDGQPTARDRQSAPARLGPLDEIDAVFVWLWREAGYWMNAAGIEARPIADLVRRGDDLQPIGPAGIVGNDTDGDRLHRDAQQLVRIILAAWPTIEYHFGAPHLWGQAEARAWTEDVDRELLRPLARWPLDRRDPVPARPRECPLCQQRDVWADLDHDTGLCAACGHVVKLEEWQPIGQAAKSLGRGRRTVERWVADGDVRSRTVKGRREIEMHSARDTDRLMQMRATLGIGAS